MVQPTQLLKNLGVVGRLIQHSLVRRLGTIKLRDNISMLREKRKNQAVAHIFLLFMNMSNLEPNVLLGQRSRGGIDNIFKALQNSSVKLSRQYVSR